MEEKRRAYLIHFLDQVLEKESCAYRFVGGLITEITTRTEVKAIDDAIATGSVEVRQHLLKALGLLSDRKKPDYPNSVKESVSAIEAAARIKCGKKNATLADALKLISGKTPLHPAFLKMLQSLYGYAGDEGGVRHANKEGALPVLQPEAQLILVLAAACCTYLVAKGAE